MRTPAAVHSSGPRHTRTVYKEARLVRRRPARCSQWVSGWLGSRWGRALGGSTGQSQPHEPSGDAGSDCGRCV